MWLPPPLCAIPTNHHHCVRCPALSAVCVLVVGLGTAAHCGGTHAGVALCLAPGHHTHLPRCPRLSPLSSLLPPNPPSHTHTNGTAHSTHTWRALCASSHPLTHTLVASLPTHPPHTLVGVRVLIHLLSCAITHTAQAQAWRLPGCFGVVVTTTTPLVPHTHTQGLVVGAMVVVGGGRVGTVWLPRHATHSPCLPPHTPHPPPHTPWRVVCLARLATPTTTTQPHHTHTTTATVPQWWLPLVTTPSTHTPHTPHTKGKHRRGCGFWCGTTTTLVLAIRCLLFFPSCPPTPFSLSLACTHTPSSPHQQHHHPIHPLCVVCVLWEWTDGWTTLWLSTPHTALLMGVLIGDTIQPFHPPSPLSLCFCPPPTTTPSLFSAHHTHTEEKGRVGMDLLVLWVCDGWCGWHVWFVGGVVCWLCFAWLAHPITLSTPNHHHSPLFLSLHHPTLLSLSVWKREWTTKWMVWNGVWCVACNTSATVLSSSHHQPLCVSGPSPFPSHSQTPSFLPCLVCLDRKSEGQVWDSPCQTHCAPHPIHTTLFPSNHTPLFNEHMVDWFVMHQNTFHPSMVLCPLLMHKPFPPHSCFAIPFHHSTHQPPLLFSFSLFPIPFPFTTLMPCHHSTLFHSIHVLIVMI